jgi:peptidoglycan/LPS O-acetylase OafA/YrhL
MLYFLGVTTTTFTVVWLVNLTGERASLVLCLAVSLAAGALAWLAMTISEARNRRRPHREQSRREKAEARRQLTDRLASVFSV